MPAAAPAPAGRAATPRFWDTAAVGGAFDVRVCETQQCLDLEDVLAAATASRSRARRYMTEWRRRRQVANVFTDVSAGEDERRVHWSPAGRLGKGTKPRVVVSPQACVRVLQCVAVTGRGVAPGVLLALVDMEDGRCGVAGAAAQPACTS